MMMLVIINDDAGDNNDDAGDNNNDAVMLVIIMMMLVPMHSLLAFTSIFPLTVTVAIHKATGAFTKSSSAPTSETGLSTCPTCTRVLINSLLRRAIAFYRSNPSLTNLMSVDSCLTSPSWKWWLLPGITISTPFFHFSIFILWFWERQCNKLTP